MVMPTEEAAMQFATHLRQLGCDVSYEQSHCVTELPWDVVVAKNMVPSYAGITEFENDLQQIADKFGGRNDG